MCVRMVMIELMEYVKVNRLLCYKLSMIVCMGCCQIKYNMF